MHNFILNCFICLEIAPAPAMLTLHKVWCYPIQFVTPAPRLPPVEYMADKDQTYVRFNGERFLINTVYLQKLVIDISSKCHLLNVQKFN